MIGVTCDPGLAVARGVWRKLRTGRSVRSATLLRSHRLFSEHFERTAHLVDVATLYHTGAGLQSIVLSAATRSSGAMHAPACFGACQVLLPAVAPLLRDILCGFL